jgi:TrpR family trp operon transcriptional repressor
MNVIWFIFDTPQYFVRPIAAYGMKVPIYLCHQHRCCYNLISSGITLVGNEMRAGWELVVEKVLTHSNLAELTTLFALLFTEEERSAVAGRLKVFQLLLEGELSQRQIAAQYQISIATITRCSNYLKHMDSEEKDRVKQLIL